MDRSSRQLARSERVSNSPYKRPQQTPAQPKAPLASFPSLRSIYSFVTAPFSRQPLLPQTNRDLPIDEDQKSQSGSEDEWNGTPPPGMDKEDVFSLAAAGRSDKRLLDTEAQEYSGFEEDQFRSGPSPAKRLTANFAAPSSSTIKRPLTSTLTDTPAHRPLPSFLPQATTAAPVQSAASIALTAFIEAKKGGNMSPQDMRVMRALMDDMESEQAGSSRSGWTAGNQAPTPRQIKTISTATAQAGPSTPNRLVDAVRGNNGSLFSMGSPARSEGGQSRSESPATRRLRYLGPGMSPKRMLQKSRTSERPTFGTDVAEESEPKRQKLGESSGGRDTPAGNAANGAVAAVDSPMPSTTASPSPLQLRSIDVLKGSATPARPSPLGQSVKSFPATTPGARDSVKEGKRRAAEIVKDLMKEEMGPMESLKKQDYMIINPYDIGSNASTSQASEVAASALSRSISRTATPKKSILRSSLKSSGSTPLSGAAAKLDAYKPGRKLTTLELLEGKHTWTDNAEYESMESASSSPERDTGEVDELMDETPEPAREVSPSPEPAPRHVDLKAETRPMPKKPEPFQAPAFTAPQLSSPARSVPTFKPSSSPAPPASAATTKVTSSQLPPAPKFTPSAHKPTAPLAEIENSTLATISSRASAQKSVDLGAAQQKVKALPAAALPTFVFKITTSTSSLSEGLKTAALAKPLKEFKFDLTATSSSASVPAPAPSANWTCDTCMLQNPDSAKDKCQVCEADRPKPKASAPAPPPPSTSAPFTLGNFAKSSAQWTCDTCMLQNPDSAKDKCQVCEADRPKLKSASAPAPASAPTSTPFTLGNFAKPSGQWTCGTCMLQNPDSAKDKCQVCEAKRS